MSKVKLFGSIEEANSKIGIGEVKELRIGDKSFCIGHSKEGFYLFEKTCPHMDYPLYEGVINSRNEIVCPWHAHRYNLKDGEECFQRSGPLKTYPIKKENGAIIVELK